MARIMWAGLRGFSDGKKMSSKTKTNDTFKIDSTVIANILTKTDHFLLNFDKVKFKDEYFVHVDIPKLEHVNDRYRRLLSNPMASHFCDIFDYEKYPELRRIQLSKSNTDSTKKKCLEFHVISLEFQKKNKNAVGWNSKILKLIDEACSRHHLYTDKNKDNVMELLMKYLRNISIPKTELLRTIKITDFFNVVFRHTDILPYSEGFLKYVCKKPLLESDIGEILTSVHKLKNHYRLEISYRMETVKLLNRKLKIHVNDFFKAICVVEENVIEKKLTNLKEKIVNVSFKIDAYQIIQKGLESKLEDKRKREIVKLKNNFEKLCASELVEMTIKLDVEGKQKELDEIIKGNRMFRRLSQLESTIKGLSEKLKVKIDGMNDPRKCQICYDREKNSVAWPCGHAMYCYVCILEMKEGIGKGICAFCKCQIKEIKKIYIF